MSTTGQEEVSKLSDNDKPDKDKITDSDQHFYPDGDITLVSSDNVRFKVHKYHLMSASLVFRDMLATPAPTEKADIHLSDPLLENAQMLASFFGLVYEAKAPPSREVIVSVDLWRLMQKYDCPVYSHLLTLEMQRRALLNGDPWNIAVFVFGAAVGNIDLCCDSIVSGRGRCPWGATLAKAAKPPLSREEGGRNTFDLAAMPVHWLELIPHRYLQAYLRSTWPIVGNPATTTKERDPTNEEVSKKFRELLEAKCGRC